jgi:hypothetical protein
VAGALGGGATGVGSKRPGHHCDRFFIVDGLGGRGEDGEVFDCVGHLRGGRR